jgi:hypothetical protein
MEAFKVCGDALTLVARQTEMDQEIRMANIEEVATAVWDAQKARDRWMTEAKAIVEQI